MKRRNNIIIALALVAVALLAITECVFFPQQRQEERNYSIAQQNPVTHDLDTVLRYKSKYMGDASNNINLFHTLPLNEYLKDFKQNPDLFELTVNYNIGIGNIVIGLSDGEVEEQTLEKALIYNSTAAFALIDNLQTLNYHLSDRTYTITRSSIQSAVSKNPAALLTKAAWKTNLQDKLRDSGYIVDTFQRIAPEMVIE